MGLLKKQKSDSTESSHEKAGKTMTEKDAKKALKSNQKKAEELLKDARKMNDFLRQLDAKFNAVTGLKDKFADIPIIVSLIRSYIKGEYRELPLGTAIGLVSALIYFFSPVDIIPDFLPGLGYVDDLMVVAVALKFSYTDLDAYKKWLAEKGNQSEEDGSEDEENESEDNVNDNNADDEREKDNEVETHEL